MAGSPYDNGQPVSATLQSAAAATGNGTAIDMRGFNALAVLVVHTTTPTLTVTFEGSIDGGTTYFSLGLTSLADHSTVASTSASSGSNVTYAGALPASRRIPLTHFRARVSAYTAGAVTVTAVKSNMQIAA